LTAKTVIRCTVYITVGNRSNGMLEACVYGSDTVQMYRQTPSLSRNARKDDITTN